MGGKTGKKTNNENTHPPGRGGGTLVNAKGKLGLEIKKPG